MCLLNPSSTLFCAVQVASEGACSGYDSMTKRNRHLQPLRRDGYTPKQPMQAVTWCAARKLELQMPGLEAARSSGVRRMLGLPVLCQQLATLDSCELWELRQHHMRANGVSYLPVQRGVGMYVHSVAK
jgi:hypothetical protein